MSDGSFRAVPPPPAPRPGASPGVGRVLLPILVGLLGFLLGLGIGRFVLGERVQLAEPMPAETVTAVETVTQTVTETVTETVTQTPTAPTSPTAPPAADDILLDGTFTAGQFEFSEVTIREDSFEDFEVSATVTNTGGDVATAEWTVRILDAAGEELGTASASGGPLAAGASADVRLISFDDYAPGADTVEFVVDSQT